MTSRLIVSSVTMIKREAFCCGIGLTKTEDAPKAGEEKMKKKICAALIASFMFSFAACSKTEDTKETAAPSETAKTEETVLEDSPSWVAGLPEAKDADQLFVVAAVRENTAYISMHEKDKDGNWKQIMTTPGFIGKKGLGKTKEGDAMTPVGTFGFNYAFGIADDPGCAIKYQKVTEDDYWSGDQRDGYHYNEMVSIKDLPDLSTDDSEHIVDYVNEYQYCLNISYNDDCVPGAGSAIFLHCLGPIKPYTGGCVAIPEEEMVTVMKNVDPDCVVIIGEMKELCPDKYEEFGLNKEDWSTGVTES